MSDPLKEYARIRELAEAAKAAAMKSEGELEAAMKRLQSRFGISTVKEGKALLEKLTQQEAAAKTTFEKALAKFKETWSDELGAH